MTNKQLERLFNCCRELQKLGYPHQEFTVRTRGGYYEILHRGNILWKRRVNNHWVLLE